MKKITFLVAFSFLCFFSLTVSAQKLTPEEVIAKHLEAIGAEETRASIKSRVLVGEAKLRVKGGRLGEAGGPAVMASENEKYLIGMTIGSTNYPHEKIGYDGKTLKVAFLRPGARSIIGNFFVTNPFFFREGLLGGTLSSAWALANLKSHDAKIQYGGLKKIGDQQVHELEYLPKKGANFSIKLFFEAESFRHVRSEYLMVVGATQGATVDDSGRRSDTRYRVIEEFADFKKESGLMLPHTYRMNLSIFGQGVAASEQEWQIQLVRFAFNQKIPPESFNTEAQ
ncbi:MAG: hypothetical protein U0Y68_05880 [Blastocatellia bacterium]